MQPALTLRIVIKTNHILLLTETSILCKKTHKLQELKQWTGTNMYSFNVTPEVVFTMHSLPL